MISTVYRNLLQNAVKFSLRDSEVITKIEKDNEGGKIILSVSDSGIGIDEETQDALFTLGRAKTRPGTSKEKGSGLGLILCKELIKENGGELYFESQSGKGTTFFVVLDSAC